MTAISLAQLPNGRQQFINANGAPLVGGTVGTYIPSTLTPKATYTDSTGSTSNANPLTLDALGSAAIWGNGLYRQIVKDSSGNVIWDTTSYAPGQITITTTSTGQFFDSVAAATAATIDPTINTIITTGYYAVGDGGGASYKRSVSAGTYPGSYFRSVDGAYWTYVPDSRGINVRAFGATSDNSTTSNLNRQGIQNAIDFAIYGLKAQKVYIPGGTYTVDNWLHLGYGDTLHSCALEGDEPSFANSGAFGGTTLIFTAKDRPGLCVSGARLASVSGIALYGQNQTWITSHNFISYNTPPTLNDLILDNWFDPSLTNANSQYTPYSSIVIDAFCGVQPAVHYPNVSYPSWSGISTQYNKSPSDEIYLTRLNIIGWGWAIAIQPSNFNGNGDFVHLLQVQASYCAGMVTAGNNQGRALNVENCGFAFFHTAYLDYLHGQQQGQFDLISLQTDYGAAIQIIDCRANVGTSKFVGGYCEGLYRFGQFGSPGTDDNPTLSLESMTFTLNDIQNDFRGYPVAWIDPGTPAAISIRDCMVLAYKDFLPFGGPGHSYTLENNRGFNKGEGSSLTQTYQQIAHDATAGGFVFMPISIFVNRPKSFTGQFVPVDLSTGTYGGTVPVNIVYRSKRAFPVVIHSRWAEGYSNEGDVQPIPKSWNTAGALASAFSSVTLSNGVLTLVFNTLSDDLALHTGPSPGDILYHDASRLFFRVRSRSGTTVIAQLTTGYNYVGGTFSGGVNTGGVITPLVTFDNTAGNFYVCNCRIFRPSNFVQADTTSGSTALTNAGNAQGSTFFFTNEVVIGDGIWKDITIDSNIPQTAAQITNVVGGTITITAPGVVLTTLRYPLQFLVRQPPTNV